MKIFSKSSVHFRISLTFKFIIAMFCLVLMSAVAFGYFFAAKEMALLRTHLEDEGKLIVNSISRFSDQGIMHSDPFILQRLAEKIVEGEDVVFCSIFDKDGKQLVHVVKKGASSGPTSTYQVTQSIRSEDGQQIGTSQIGFSLFSFQTYVGSI